MALSVETEPAHAGGEGGEKHPATDGRRIMASSIQLATGLGGAIGSDVRKVQNQLLFVEFAGKLSRLNLYRTATVVMSTTATLNGTWILDLETGAQTGVDPQGDIWWEQQTSVLRRMTPRNAAQVVNLGIVDFNAITPDTLASLTYSSTPIIGNNDATNKLVNGDVFAVRTNKGNYAKVQVMAYGYNIQLRWVTYKLDPTYAVLGTGYQQPEDVKASVNPAHAYLTERTGALHKVPLAGANRAAANVVVDGMTAPHQIFLNESNNAAYVVEFANPGKLWKIDLVARTKTALVSNLENAVGLVLSSDLQYAYVSEQTAGPDQGRITRILLSNGSRQVLKTGLTNPFMLSWLDPSQTTLVIPERDPANRISLLNVVTLASSVALSAVPSRPSSVGVFSPGLVLVCSDQEITQVDLGMAGLQPSGPLLMGIGFVPFDKVTGAGLANTSGDPSYFFQVANAPFGGTLPLMVNYMRAFNDGAAYYRIKVDGALRLDVWTDYRWNGFEYVIQTVAPQVVGAQPGYYPVRPVSQLFLWMNPSLGGMIDSRSLTNGTHTILLEFTNGAGTVLATSTPLSIRVDNKACSATISFPTLNGGAVTTDSCGLIRYGVKDASLVEIAFTAGHPSGFATYGLSLIKGLTSVTMTPPPAITGPVGGAHPPISETVMDLMGACDIAGFAAWVYVWAMATNGWGRQSQYDASAAVAFVMAP